MSNIIFCLIDMFYLIFTRFDGCFGHELLFFEFLNIFEPLRRNSSSSEKSDDYPLINLLKN